MRHKFCGYRSDFTGLKILSFQSIGKVQVNLENIASYSCQVVIYNLKNHAPSSYTVQLCINIKILYICTFGYFGILYSSLEQLHMYNNVITVFYWLIAKAAINFWQKQVQRLTEILIILLKLCVRYKFTVFNPCTTW